MNERMAWWFQKSEANDNTESLSKTRSIFTMCSYQRRNQFARPTPRGAKVNHNQFAFTAGLEQNGFDVLQRGGFGHRTATDVDQVFGNAKGRGHEGDHLLGGWDGHRGRGGGNEEEQDEAAETDNLPHVFSVERHFSNNLIPMNNDNNNNDDTCNRQCSRTTFGTFLG